VDTVPTVKVLQRYLAASKSCKVKLRSSGRMQAAIIQAGVSDKLDTGIQLIPRDVTKILLAAVCEIGTIVAKATFEGYAIGLKRKGEDLFLYFSKHGPSAES